MRDGARFVEQECHTRFGVCCFAVNKLPSSVDGTHDARLEATVQCCTWGSRATAATVNRSEPSQLERRPAEGDSLFAGGGEVGFLLSRIDWSKTPLGAASNWSPALRTMVGMVLKNRSPLVLWWGTELVQIYNDAFRSILASKHPRALAQPASECWSEIWSVVGPMIEAPLRGQPATGSDDLLLLVNRKGFLEETHFRFAYSPVPDESLTGAAIGGVLGTVAEISEEVYAGRQLATLRDLARPAGDAATGAMACEHAARVLGGNDRDVPCSLLYLLDTTGDRADLAGSSGFAQALRDGSLPETITFDDGAAAVWPLDRAHSAKHPERARKARSRGRFRRCLDGPAARCLDAAARPGAGLTSVLARAATSLRRAGRGGEPAP